MLPLVLTTWEIFHCSRRRFTLPWGHAPEKKSRAAPSKAPLRTFGGTAMGHETELRQIECLNNRQIYRRLMRLIHDAKHQIFLVSPFIDPNPPMLAELVAAATRGVRVEIRFRDLETERYRRTRWFNALADVGVRFCEVPRLHSKIYVIDDRLIRSSMNLTRSSFHNNFENAQVFPMRRDPLFAALLDELTGIERRARPVSVLQPRLPFRDTRCPQGYCIHCARSIPLNPKRPYCPLDYYASLTTRAPVHQDWHCHQCGERTEASRAHPRCEACEASSSAPTAKILRWSIGRLP